MVTIKRGNNVIDLATQPIRGDTIDLEGQVLDISTATNVQEAGKFVSIYELEQEGKNANEITAYLDKHPEYVDSNAIFVYTEQYQVDLPAGPAGPAGPEGPGGSGMDPDLEEKIKNGFEDIELSKKRIKKLENYSHTHNV